MSSTKKRLPRGEAKLIIEQWCNDYVRDHDGAKPTYTEAQKGTAVAAMTFSKPWKNWETEFDAKQSAGHVASPAPLAPVVVPVAIADAWGAAVAAVEAAKVKELEADKVLVRREVTQLTAEKTALATELNEILADSEEMQEEFEQERIEAAAALSSAMATIAERDAAITAKADQLVQIQKAFAVQDAELKEARKMVEKLESSLERALLDERAAHTNCEKALGELAEAQVVSARVGDELKAAMSTLSATEATLKAKDEAVLRLQEKLDACRQEVSLRTAELAGASATEAGLREQLAAAEIRSEQSRQRWEAEADTMRERIIMQERELAALRQANIG